MAGNKSQKKALAALNYDLFTPEKYTQQPLAATVNTTVKVVDFSSIRLATIEPEKNPATLPTSDELERMFERFNWMYFSGQLPSARIEYSNRMLSAGSYTPSSRLIRIGRKYHELYPEDIADTIKHEMIHIKYINHDKSFKKEARRIGASLKARSHPSLQRPPRYLYRCENCGMEYPRRKRLIMASCGDCSTGRKFDPRFKLKLVKK